MSEAVRIALIGCGGIANAHIRGYQTVREKGMLDFEIPAVCDTVEANAERAADQIAAFQSVRPRTYTDVGALLDAETLHGADICVPHGLQHSVAEAALNAGLHVMVEKPIGVTIKASEVIRKAAERNGRFAATAENCRRYLGQRAVEWAINTKGLIGEPRMFFAISLAWREPKPGQPMPWRADRYLGGCGMVMDSGAHWVDTLRYFFGDVDTVYARTGYYERRMMQHPTKGEVQDAREDAWTSILTFKHGLTGTWAWSIAAPGTPGSLVAFYGSEGSIEDPGEVFHPFCFNDNGKVVLKDGREISLPELKQMYLSALSEDERQRLFPHDVYDGFTIEVFDFLDAIRSGRPPEIDVVEGTKAKAISEAIYESAWAGRAVRVEDVLSGKIEGYQRDINQYWGL